MTGSAKIFGIGLNKTGTSTLRTCLQHLGYRHLGFDRDLLKAYSRGDLETVFAAIERHDSFEDWPYPLMFRELFERYGKTARFILTTRATPQTWLNSLKAHTLRTDPLNQSHRLVYGYDYPHGYESEHLAFYERHNAAVHAFFAGREQALLPVCWETGDGWTQLCTFLGAAVPAIPFPHTYRSETLTPNPSRVALNERNIAAQLAALERQRQRKG
ncbi:MAG TPA: sulfotransferase [Rhizomicrobium sp.]|nr:sulfotransferase [Rhizomicrobium sp.]